MILLILLLITSLILSYLLKHRRIIYLTWMYPKLKNLFHVPIFGHIGLIQYINPTMEGMMNCFHRLASESGQMLYIGNYRIITISKAEHFEVVLTHPNTQEKNHFYDFFAEFNGDSIFCIGGKQWQRNRRAMAPTMNPKAVALTTEDTCMCAHKLADKWRPKIGCTFDAMTDIAECLMEMFAKIAFGVDMNGIQDGTDFYEELELFIALTMKRVMNMFIYSDFIYSWTKDYRTQQRAIKHGYEISDKIMDERQVIYDQNLLRQMDEVPMEDNQTQQRSFLDHLFDLRKDSKLSPKEVKGEVNTFMVAGYDTCSSAVAFALNMLAMHQDIQEKVYQELIDVLGPDRSPEYSDLPKLVYLEQVINESMRLFPPVPLLARVAKDEFQLDGHTVPKNTQIALYLLDIHRSNLYWKDPLKFDPERFSPDGLSKQTKYSYIPFLAGPRVCFGTRLAWIMLKCSLATLVRRYKFDTPVKTVEEIEVAIKFTLKPKHGIFLKLQER